MATSSASAPPGVKCAMAMPGEAATSSAASSTWGGVTKRKTSTKDIVRACCAMAATTSSSPWPRMSASSAEVPSRYSLPSASQVRTPWPWVMMRISSRTVPWAPGGE